MKVKQVLYSVWNCIRILVSILVIFANVYNIREMKNDPELYSKVYTGDKMGFESLVQVQTRDEITILIAGLYLLLVLIHLFKFRKNIYWIIGFVCLDIILIIYYLFYYFSL